MPFDPRSPCRAPETVQGDAAEGDGVSEEILFDGASVRADVSSSPTATTDTTLQDTTQDWTPEPMGGLCAAVARRRVGRRAHHRQ